MMLHATRHCKSWSRSPYLLVKNLKEKKDEQVAADPWSKLSKSQRAGVY